MSYLFLSLVKTFFFITLPIVEAECVKVSMTHLRKSPSASSAKTWTVGRYTPLIRLKRKGRWLQVKDLDGQKHWVQREKVSQELRCLMVKAPSFNVRTGPGSKYRLAKVKQVEKYMPLLRLEKKGDWYKVKDRFRNTYWIHRKGVWRPVKISNIGF